jgi:hypothetical protein
MEGYMKLEVAIGGLLAGRSYSPADRQVIDEVVNLLGAHEFDYTKDYIFDVSDKLHIHRTMIVSSIPLPGFVHRGPDPYPNYQYFKALTRFRRTGK